MGFSFALVREVLAQVGVFLSAALIGLRLLLLQRELQVYPLLLADLAVVALIGVALEERPAHFFGLASQRKVGVLVIVG